MAGECSQVNRFTESYSLQSNIIDEVRRCFGCSELPIGIYDPNATCLDVCSYQRSTLTSTA